MNKAIKIPHVAVLISTENDWGRRIIRGALSYSNNVGPWHINVKSDRIEAIDSLPANWQGTGIIARVVSKEHAARISELGLPVVNINDTPVEGFTSPCVRTDDDATTRTAADFFIGRGFRNIAYAGPLNQATPVWFAEHFQRILASHSLKCSMFAYEQTDETKSYEELSKWLVNLPKPVGILCWGSGEGAQIINCCMEAGLSVPHEVSVLSGGYDDIRSHTCSPPLSGIQTPTEQIGYKAAELLHKMMNGEAIPHKNTYLPPSGIREHLSTDTLAVEDPALRPVVEFLREHAFEPITMKDVMKVASMNRRTLERRYVKVFGRSPVDEIRYLRIDKARRLLVDTDKPLQIIAEECGYSTYNYLSHVFNQVAGMSPSAYRKKMRAN